MFTTSDWTWGAGSKLAAVSSTQHYGNQYVVIYKFISIFHRARCICDECESVHPFNCGFIWGHRQKHARIYTCVSELTTSTWLCAGFSYVWKYWIEHSAASWLWFVHELDQMCKAATNCSPIDEAWRNCEGTCLVLHLLSLHNASIRTT